MSIKKKKVIDRKFFFSDSCFRMNYLQESIGFVRKIDFGIIRVKVECRDDADACNVTGQMSTEACSFYRYPPTLLFPSSIHYWIVHAACTTQYHTQYHAQFMILRNSQFKSQRRHSPPMVLTPAPSLIHATAATDVTDLVRAARSQQFGHQEVFQIHLTAAAPKALCLI